MARSSLIAVVTFSSVAFSAVISIFWFFAMSGASRFAPAVHIFGLLGGLTGVLVGRRASARERRHLALATLIDELRRDASILDDPQYVPSKETPRPRVYPRLPVSATDAVLTLGALAERSDEELLRRLHNWRDDVNGFNRRLELTEFLSFTSGNPAEIADFERALHRSDGGLNRISHDLRNLRNYLDANYQVVSEHYERSGGSGGPRGWWLFHRIRRLASSMPSIKAVRSAWWRWAGHSSR
jgi:hypothetical protein